MPLASAARFLARGPLRAELLCAAWELFSAMLFVSAILPAALTSPWPAATFAASLVLSGALLGPLVRMGERGVVVGSVIRLAAWVGSTAVLPSRSDPRALIATLAFGTMAVAMRRAIYRRELSASPTFAAESRSAIARGLRRRLGESAMLAGILGGHVLLLFGVAFLRAESALIFRGWWQLVPAMALGATLSFTLAVRVLTSDIARALAAGPKGDRERLEGAVDALGKLPGRLSLVNFALWVVCSSTGVFYFRTGSTSFQGVDAVMQLGYAALFSWGVAFYQRGWDRDTVAQVERLLRRWAGEDDRRSLIEEAEEEPARKLALRERMLREFGWPLLFTAALLLLSSIGLYRAVGGVASGDAPAALLALFAAFFMLALAVGGVIARVARELSRPIVQVAEAAELVASGSLEAPVPRVSGPTEIERLSTSVERMREHLARTIGELEHERSSLEQRVEARTAELGRALRELQDAQAALVQGERLASIGELMAGVAHEIYNPLNAVAGSSEPLEEVVRDVREMLEAYAAAEPELPPARRAELAALRARLDLASSLDDLSGITRLVRRATERTVRIVQSLKNFSRTGGEASPADLEAGLEETLALLGSRIRHADIAVERRLGGLPQVVCRAGEIHQVLMNLLVNAVQALEAAEKPRRLVLSTHVEGPRAVLVVEDSGPGVPDAIAHRIFDPFFTTKPQGQGTGLGLSISTDIVRRHGGTLSVEHPPEGGARFVIRLPIEGSAQSKR